MPNKKTSHYAYLADKWTEKHKKLQANLINKHKKSFEWLSSNSKQLALSSLAGLTILSAPGVGHTGPGVRIASEQAQKIDNKAFVVSDLAPLLPDQVRPMSINEETKIENVLSKSYGINVKADVNGLRLNRSYGIIGAEQHLARYPGDNMTTHFDPPAGGQTYSSGMAPGLGAWGYFTTSASQMTKEDSDREKYYIAVQTFFAPDFEQKVAEYRDFFKYRKMLVVNPENGKAVVADIGDAGPAEWTGKHLGGSPEVMAHLERFDGAQRGPVLYFFIDDPNNNIPLGPVEPIGNDYATI